MQQVKETTTLMTKQKIIASFYQLVRIQFGSNTFQMKMDDTFEQIKFDNYDIMTLIMRIEEIYGVDFGDMKDSLDRLVKLRDLFDLLMQKLIEKGTYVPDEQKKNETVDETEDVGPADDIPKDDSPDTDEPGTDVPDSIDIPDLADPPPDGQDDTDEGSTEGGDASPVDTNP